MTQSLKISRRQVGGTIDFAPAYALLLILIGFTSAPNLAAQSSRNAQEEVKGFDFYLDFHGSSNELGEVTKLDPMLADDFNQYFGLDAGLPVYHVRSRKTGATSTGIGNAYVALRLTVLHPALNFVSRLSGTAPTGDVERGLSTGRAPLWPPATMSATTPSTAASVGRERERSVSQSRAPGSFQ